MIVNKFALYTALQTVKHAAGKNDVRYYLNCINLRLCDGVLRVTATDGHRAALCDVAVRSGADFELSLDIHHLDALLGYIKTVARDLTEIELNETLDGYPFVKLGEHKYPDVDSQFRAFPNQESVATIGMNAGYMVDALRAFGAISNKKGVRITNATDKILIEATHAKCEYVTNIKSLIMSMRL